ncbi:HSP20-like chaperone [Lophiostoma macrostomum CBS 122681]|uniref:HSP20-like chaperone n=1 Tax=Lophiostoma macrostomum CBS 122681 TaxID=1314788 RepID=A0A6A6TAP4_9PLEO|nr:HSP20-like chaperone [Lophiostoma macrostomum CBS 122681]
MAFFLTPRFAPAYQQCGPFSCAPARPRVSRPAFPSFVPFLNQVDELLSEIDREARRAAHQQRQQRKRAFRTRFDVRESQEGYQVEGEVPGFEQENISIEVTDEHTLKVAGNTEQKSEQIQAQPQLEAQATPAPPAEVFGAQASESEKMDGVTVTESEVRPSTPDSDTSSHKSYQPTVEDDFEDLGAETSSTISAPSTPAEPKGKEKAVEQPTETAVQEAPKPEAPTQQEPEHREWLSERVHGSFERTFQFPERIDAENVRAALKNGVLSITVPKAPAPKIRSITIQ